MSDNLVTNLLYIIPETVHEVQFCVCNISWLAYINFHMHGSNFRGMQFIEQSVTEKVLSIVVKRLPYTTSVALLG
jgi:hypothetical protein